MKIVVLSGAGISAESGISTFRDADGLWENHDIMEVASYDGWKKNPQLVMDFYNQRRRQLKEVVPNIAHLALTKLEEHFEVTIITQNVDNLHERAGSSNIIHLHGKLNEVKEDKDLNDDWWGNNTEVLDWNDDLMLGERSHNGIQLRPNIVWFGEPVPNMNVAEKEVSSADLLLVIGTSLQVYPAAGLLHNIKHNKIHIFNTEMHPTLNENQQHIGTACETVPKFVDDLISNLDKIVI
jgi:NAD-dependent deacetylase